VGFLDRLFGRRAPEPTPQRPAPAGRAPYAPMGTGGSGAPQSEDDRALARYRYMLQTAPPETIEQAHAEAFAQLTPEQRARVLRELTEAAPASERASIAAAGDDPRALARQATRAEMRQPGFMERSFAGGGGGGMGMGGMMAGTIFGSLVAGFVGSMVAQQFMASMGDPFSDEAGAGDLAGEADTLSAAEEPAYGEEMAADDLGTDDLGDDFGGDF
jgi:hypothetical protein